MQKAVKVKTRILSMTEIKGRCFCRGGFTLIELLTVAAVIAASVIASAALMLRNQSKTKVIQTAQQLTLAARAARVRAVESGQSCRLVLDPQNRCFFIRTSSSDEPQAVLSGPYSKPVQLPESIRLEQVLLLDSEQTDIFEIEFKPNGSAQTAVIQLSDGGKNQATVTIHQISGRVKMTRGALTTLLVDRIDLDEEQTAI